MPANLAERRARYAEELAAALERIVARLASMPEVRRVILFGSYARGRRDLRTDLDLIVVLDTPLPFIERTVELYRLLLPGVPMDLLAYTPEEWERMRTRPFIRQALVEGEVLYEA